MPKTSAQARSGYIVSVRDTGSPVKPKLKNVTESVQFKRWFGDWQRHTKDVSKIQNADGSPIAPVVIDGYAKQNNVLLDSNAVTSIHGRNNAVTKLLANALNDYTNGQNTLFYWNKKQAIALLQKTRVVMPKDSAQIHDGYIASIRDVGSPVKARYSIMKSRSAQSYESEIERLKKQRDEAKRQIKLSRYQEVTPAGIKRMAQDLLAEYRSTANAEELIDTLNKSDSFLNQTCFFSLRYTVRYMVEKLAAPPSRLEIGSARKTPLTPSPAKCGRRSVSGMTTMPFRKMEKKMA